MSMVTRSVPSALVYVPSAAGSTLSSARTWPSAAKSAHVWFVGPGTKVGSVAEAAGARAKSARTARQPREAEVVRRWWVRQGLGRMGSRPHGRGKVLRAGDDGFFRRRPEDGSGTRT